MASVASEKPSESTASRRRSCDTVCSSNSSCLLQKRKSIHPLANSFKHMTISTRPTNAVKQRVLSARLLKLRSLQSQLNDANFHLAELQQENKALKSLQRRQDRALVKYEGENADLPRLLHAHEEERRVLLEKNRQLKRSLRDVQEQLKGREEELLGVRDQVKSLTALSKNRNLGERQALFEQVEELKEQLRSGEEQIGQMNRKLTIEMKNSKQRLNMEMAKHKQTQRELTQALMEIGKLSNMLEGKPQRKSVNIKIHNRQPNKVGLPDRLLANFTRPNNPDEINSGEVTGRSDEQTDKLGVVEERDEPEYADDDDDDDEMRKPTYAPASILKKVDSRLPQPILKTVGREMSVEQKFADCCTDILSSVKECNEAVDSHRKEYKMAQSDELRLRECLRETDSIDSQLRHSDFFQKFQELDIPNGDADIVNEIWKSEFQYQKEIKRSGEGTRKFDVGNRNGIKRREKERGFSLDKTVGVDEKNKLLAALKAIDEGEDTDFY